MALSKKDVARNYGTFVKQYGMPFIFVVNSELKWYN